MLSLLVNLLSVLIGGFIGIVGSRIAQRAQLQAEDRRRREDIRGRAVERCADLLYQDDAFIRQQLHRALKAEGLEVGREPGLEAVALFRIYFAGESTLDVEEYGSTRRRTMEAVRQCGIAAVLAEAAEVARPSGSGLTEQRRELVVRRDEVYSNLEQLNESRDRLVVKLAALMEKQLLPSP